MEVVTINITDIVENITLTVTEGVSDNVVIYVEELGGAELITINDTPEIVNVEITDISQALQGDSAYKVAVDNGYEGTEVQWIDSLKGTNGITPVKGVDYFDGITPVKGIDYFDGEDSTIPGPSGYSPIKGIDYFDGNDGYTPIKGVDYFDGVSGVKGDTGDPGTTDFTLLTNKPTSLSDINSAEGTKLSGINFVGLAKITVDTSAPENPGVGDIWIDTTN